MSSRVLSTALLLLASLPCYAGPKPCDLPQRPQVDCVVPAHPVLVGQIVIVGNTETPQQVILSQLPFYPGQLLNTVDLKRAEQNLSRLDIFQCDPEGTGIRPTVTVLDPDGPAPVKDILVEVQERCGAVCHEGDFDPCIIVQQVKTGNLLFGLGVNSDAGFTSSVGCASKCDADKPACSCEKDCSCCGCQKVQEDEDIESIVNCNCGEGCKCCGCKKTIAANGCAGEGEGCCLVSSDCCAGGAVGCFLLEQCCPMFQVCGMCPVVQIQVRQAMRPCVKQVVAACKQMFKQTATGGADCSDSCAEKLKASKCGECRQRIRVEIRVCPWTGGAAKKPIGFVWKKGQKFEQLTVMPKEEAVKQAAGACPCLKQQQVDRLEKKQPRQVGMAVTPLDNLDKLEKAQSIMRLADFLYESGKYDMAVQRYRKVMALVPGSHWDAQAQDSIVMAQAMKGIDEWYAQFGQQVLEAHLEEMKKNAAEEAEPVQQEKPLPCEPVADDPALQEFKEKFCALLDQARCAVQAGDIEIAKRLVQEAGQLPRPDVAVLLEAAQECIAAGCCEEAWDKVNHVLMLDPNCMAAQELQRQLIDMAASQCDQCPFSSGCEQEEPPCGDDAAASYDPLPCPGIGFRHELPAVDPSIVEVMERVLIECARPDRYDYDGDCEEQKLEIDDEACELELLEDGELYQPLDPNQLGKLLHQLDAALSEWVDGTGKSAARGHGRMNIAVEFGSGSVQYKFVMHKDGVNVAGVVEVVVQLPATPDLREWQEAHNEEMMKWIENMSGCGPIEDGDSEEAEEPLFQLETDLDPDW